MQLRGRAGDHLYVRVADTFREDIECGVLRPGEQLPATRFLAQQWEVTPKTVEHGFRILRAEGYVVSRRRGSFVRDGLPLVRDDLPTAATEAQAQIDAMRETLRGLIAQLDRLAETLPAHPGAVRSNAFDRLTRR